MKVGDSLSRVTVKKHESRQAQDVGGVAIWNGVGDICCEGYVSLDKCPEIVTAISKISQLISMITIHLMTNTKDGDVRIQNELSRKIDIEPSPIMTRKSWMEAIVNNLMLYGKGNSIVLPHTENGYLGSLEVIPAYQVSFMPDMNNRSYTVYINGQSYSPDEVLHFVYNPDKYYPWKGTGLTVYLKDVADNLKQATKTTNAFMKSPKPSIIVKVDGFTQQFASPEGRARLTSEYITNTESGKPWILPANQFAVDQIKPLSIADLAIDSTMKLDKATVAAILQIPRFILGIADFNQKEWEMFINTTIRSIVTELQQEMTKKLILSPKMYLRFNYWSLMGWDLKTISDVLLAGSDRGFITGNEYRDRIGFEPREGLDELRILENYIPFNMSGAQKKLIQDGDE